MIPRRQLIISWVLQSIIAVTLFQTLFFKFSGAQESRFIFSPLGVEPWGRYAAAIFELIAVVLLLHPRTPAIGATLSLGVISGAILSHLTKLGIEVNDDGGLLFALALTVFWASAAVVIIRRSQLPLVGERLAKIRLPSNP